MRPFERLALFAASAAVAGALAAVALFVGLWVALIAVVGGGLLALLATAELQPPERKRIATPEELEQAREASKREAGGMTRRDRGDIERSARQAREED